MTQFDLYKVKRITKIQTEYPQSVCGNEHIFFLIKSIMSVLKHSVYQCCYEYGGNKNIRIEDIKEKHWLAFLNIPFTNLKNPVVRRYVDGFETEEDKEYIKKHRKYRVGLPFLMKALWAREVFEDIQKIIDLNSPLSEETQKYIIDLIILMINFQSVEVKRMKGTLLLNKEIERNKKKKGGQQKGKNAELFKEKMYEEQKKWFYERKAQRKTRYAAAFARKYYEQCKKQYKKDNTIKFPFHFTEGAEMEDDNAFAYITRAAQKNNKKILKEYLQN